MFKVIDLKLELEMCSFNTSQKCTQLTPVQN